MKGETNMDATQLGQSILQYIDVVTMLICLCVGFALKYAKIFEKFGNQYIPLVMLILGCVISISTNIPNINASVILTGMISGLSSTGLYEMFKGIVHKNDSTDSNRTEA